MYRDVRTSWIKELSKYVATYRRELDGQPTRSTPYAHECLVLHSLFTEMLTLWEQAPSSLEQMPEVTADNEPKLWQELDS